VPSLTGVIVRSVLFFVALVVMDLVLRKRRGRHVFAVGGNVEAARLSGINVIYIRIGGRPHRVVRRDRRVGCWPRLSSRRSRRPAAPGTQSDRDRRCGHRRYVGVRRTRRCSASSCRR
jgi:hypothetical protein